jgi:GNAT superfamily N-acetyltransferase
VAPIAPPDFQGVLPLIADYQRFYGVAEPDHARNAYFFRRFVAPSDDGLLLGAWRGDALVGHACLYWTFSSITAVEVVLLNDLWVVPAARGDGVGRALIDHSAAVARERDASKLVWQTQIDNRIAQGLYERMGAQRSALFEYELEL